MFHKVFNFTKQHLDIILLFFGLVCLSCTIFCFFGYGIRMYWTDGHEEELLAIYNFFSMILGGLCWCGVTNFLKLEDSYNYSVVTPTGIILIILQMLIIVITILIILNFVFKKVHSKKIVLGAIGLTVALAIASTVLTLTPVSYVALYIKGVAIPISGFFSDLDNGVVTIQLTQGQIAYVVIASIGLISIVTSIFLYFRNNHKHRVDTVSNQNVNA